MLTICLNLTFYNHNFWTNHVISNTARTFMIYSWLDHSVRPQTTSSNGLGVEAFQTFWSRSSVSYWKTFFFLNMTNTCASRKRLYLIHYYNPSVCLFCIRDFKKTLGWWKYSAHYELRVSLLRLPLKWASWGGTEAMALTSWFHFP